MFHVRNLFDRRLCTVRKFNTIIDDVRDAADLDHDGYVSYAEALRLFALLWARARD